MLHEQKPSLEEAIEHYGVKGMRWGVRRSQQELDRAAGRRTSTPRTTSKGSASETGKRQAARLLKKNGNKKLGGDYDELIAQGIAIAAVVAIKQTVSYFDSGKRDAKQTGDKEFKQNPNLTKKMSVDQLQKNVVQQINPEFPAKGTKMNCRRATLAYEMRRRGNDVQATKSSFATGQTQKGMEKSVGVKKAESIWGEKQIGDPRTFYKGTPEKKAIDVFTALQSNPNGSRGELGVGWIMGGGHSMAWEVVNNKPVIFDTQSNEVFKTPRDFEKFSKVMTDAAQTRLDDKPIDPEFIKRWVKDV